MADDVRSRIIARLATTSPTDGQRSSLCRVCVDITATTGAGIMLMASDIPAGWVCATDEVSVLIEELQFALGEGPCVDAFQLNRPVVEPNLSNPAELRWPAFRGPVLAAGVRAIFGFPMRVGAVRIGALNMYCDRPGALSNEQHGDALAMAEIAASVIVMSQAEGPGDGLVAELEGGSDSRLVVHQATGMVAVQLKMSVASALIRLRAFAFADGHAIVDVAEAVVARRLRFDQSDRGAVWNP